MCTFSCSFSNFLRSYGWIPIRLNASDSIDVLIRLSIGEDELSEGHTLTSNSQAFRS